MRQSNRRVYQGGYICFANLLYKGEYLKGFASDVAVLRYDPRDITSLYIYRAQGERDIFLTRAHAQNLETERLSLPEAKVISRRLRQVRQEITNASVLTEIRDSDKLHCRSAIGQKRLAYSTYLFIVSDRLTTY